jgi:hypothetical protein
VSTHAASTEIHFQPFTIAPSTAFAYLHPTKVYNTTSYGKESANSKCRNLPVNNLSFFCAINSEECCKYFHYHG